MSKTQDFYILNIYIIPLIVGPKNFDQKVH